MATQLTDSASRFVGPFVVLYLGIMVVQQSHAQLNNIKPAFDVMSDRIPFDHRSLETGGDAYGGLVWFDYNNDGWLDLFLPNGKMHSNALYRNDKDGTFTNVAVNAGVAPVPNTGHTAAVAADIDNDGYQDLFLLGTGGTSPPPSTGPPQVKLYRNIPGDNEGERKFEDITAASGITGPETQMSMSFGDINNDGFLDLFIASPGSFGATPAQNVQHRNQMFLNNGDLTFTDISQAAGVDTKFGSCVCFFSDWNNDGWIDLFVGDCNELSIYATPIRLFRNNRDGTFTDVAPDVGLAPVGYWMCMAPGDFDCDGDIDFFATNFGKKANGTMADPNDPNYTPTLSFDHPHALYRNEGDGTYVNVAATAKVGHFEFGWGGVLQDLNNDGYDDLFFVGNLPDPRFGYIGPGFGNPGRLLGNNQDGTFTDFTDSLAIDLSSRFASGVAHGDYDNDGFEDIAVAVSSLPEDPTATPLVWKPAQPVLLRNRGNSNNWLKIRVRGKDKVNRDGVGARVTVAAGDLLQAHEVYAGCSFASMNSPWLNFGLASHEKTRLIKVRWPNGDTEVFPNAPANNTIELVEGEGDADGDKAALMETDKAWSEAEGKTEEFLSFFAHDARFQPPDLPVANGLEEIRATVEMFFGLPGFSVIRTTDTVVVQAEGNLGYTMGTFTLTVNGVSRDGKFATIWRKVGDWKVASDTFNFDSAAPAPP